MTIFLESKKIILSPVSQSLIKEDGYFKWINDQESDLFTQHAVFPHTFECLSAYAESRLKARNSIWLAIIFKDDNKHIGNIDVSEIDWINRVGTYNILIGDRSYQGKGIGYDASHLILNHVFNRLNLNRVQLGVDERNIGALRLYKKLGFKEEGVLRSAIVSKNAYFNIIKMSILSSEYSFDI